MQANSLDNEFSRTLWHVMIAFASDQCLLIEELAGISIKAVTYSSSPPCGGAQLTHAVQITIVCCSLSFAVSKLSSHVMGQVSPAFVLLPTCELGSMQSENHSGTNLRRRGCPQV